MFGFRCLTWTSLGNSSIWLLRSQWQDAWEGNYIHYLQAGFKRRLKQMYMSSISTIVQTEGSKEGNVKEKNLNTQAQGQVLKWNKLYLSGKGQLKQCLYAHTFITVEWTQRQGRASTNGQGAWQIINKILCVSGWHPRSLLENMAHMSLGPKFLVRIKIYMLILR